MTPSGPAWCTLFPTSQSLSDLVDPFRADASEFINALRTAGASVTISATYRPPERAFLMHYCCLVAGYRDAQKIFHQIAPSDVPPFAGIDIDWTCGGDGGAARAAAVAMRQGYDIAFPAALVSRHTQRLAVDMTITFQGVIQVQSATGSQIPAACQSDLWPIGASYGVHKLPSDPPHWSSDGR